MNKLVILKALMLMVKSLVIRLESSYSVISWVKCLVQMYLVIWLARSLISM